MDVHRTSLSAGEIIRSMLIADAEVMKRANKVFPVICDNANLPYVLYRRASLSQTPTKGVSGADGVAIEVLCFTENYADGVDLAEAVRGALDHRKGNADGLVMRSCVLSDSEEAWQDDAFVQQLLFTVKI